MPSKQWSELSLRQRRLVVAVGAVEVALTTAALTDLAKRPASQVRGWKPLWALACLIQPLGPIAYLLRGRLPD